MAALIVLKQEEKVRLLESTPETSPARSVLDSARPDTSQPGLVSIMCDEKTAPELLQLSKQHCGSAWRALSSQLKRLGYLKLVLL